MYLRCYYAVDNSMCSSIRRNSLNSLVKIKLMNIYQVLSNDF